MNMGKEDLNRWIDDHAKSIDPLFDNDWGNTAKRRDKRRIRKDKDRENQEHLDELRERSFK